MENNVYAVVVGGANLDLSAQSAAALHLGDSNPGCLTTACGGVGRNIAQAMTLLGAATYLIAPLGADTAGDRILETCRSQKIIMDHALTLPGQRSSCYVSITDHDGQLIAAIADMSICDSLTPDLLEPCLPLLNGAGAVILEANLPSPVLEFLACQVRAPLFCDPVSQAKAPRLLPILEKTFTLKPNRQEAACLTGVAVTDRASADRAVDILLDRGVQRVALSMAEQGLYCADSTGRILVPPCPTQIANDTGGGDSAMAALAYGYLAGLTFRQSGELAVKAASMTLASADAVSPYLKALSREI